MVHLIDRWYPSCIISAPDMSVVPWWACGAPDRLVVPRTGRWCSWQADGAPDRPMVLLTDRWCSWQTDGAPDRPIVPLTPKAMTLTLLNLSLDPPLHELPSFHGSLPPARRRQMRAEANHTPGESKLVDRNRSNFWLFSTTTIDCSRVKMEKSLN